MTRLNRKCRVRRRMYSKRFDRAMKRYADAKVNELRSYVSELIATVERNMEDGKLRCTNEHLENIIASLSGGK